MGLSCGASLIKFFLFSINFIILLGGVLVIVSGSLLFKWLDESGLEEDKTSGLKIFLAIIIGFGCALFLTSFCGCCGAVTENRSMLSIYDAILILLCIGIFGLAIFLLIKKDEFVDSLEDILKNQMNYYDENDAKSKITWDGQQETLKCCGIKSKEDWRNTPWYRSYGKYNNKYYPKSCLDKETNVVFSKNCNQVYKEKLPWFYGLLFVVAAVLLLIIILVTYLIIKVTELHSVHNRA